jgi:hypothetical protein
MSPYAVYARLKADWLASHPNATPEQIEAAFKAIAERLGL